MSDLLVIAYPTEAQAEEMRRILLGLQREYLIELGDAVVAVKGADGEVKLNQLVSLTAAGAASGAMWGALLGLILLNPLLGAAFGAAGGALGGRLTDIGVNDKFMKEVAQRLHAGEAALFLLIRKVTADKVLASVQGTGGTILQSSFDETKEAALREALAHAQSEAAKAAPPSGTA
jgi:uncharacterized membrane protein